jgi:hypothetical protein
MSKFPCDGRAGGTKPVNKCGRFLKSPSSAAFRLTVDTMRTVWLALLCFIGLATTVVVKMGLTPYANADVSQGVISAKDDVSPQTGLTDSAALSTEDVTPATNVRNDTLAKADKLQVTYMNEAAPEVKSVKSIAIGLPTTEPKQSPEKMETVVIRALARSVRQTKCADRCSACRQTQSVLREHKSFP